MKFISCANLKRFRKQIISPLCTPRRRKHADLFSNYTYCCWYSSYTSSDIQPTEKKYNLTQLYSDSYRYLARPVEGFVKLAEEDDHVWMKEWKALENLLGQKSVWRVSHSIGVENTTLGHVSPHFRGTVVPLVPAQRGSRQIGLVSEKWDDELHLSSDLDGVYFLWM